MMSFYDLRMRIRKYVLLPFRKRQFYRFGKGSLINRPILIFGGKSISIGDDVHIRDNARIEVVPGYSSNVPKLSIGNRVGIEEGIHLTCADSVVFEDDVTILSYCMITDINHSYQEIGIRCGEQQLEVKPVRIKQYAVIGSGVSVMPGVTVGNNAIIGTNAVVTQDIPDYSVAAGIPAKVIRKYNFDSRNWERV